MIFPYFIQAIKSGNVAFAMILIILELLIIYFSGILTLFFRSIRVHLEPDKMYWTYAWLGCKRHYDPILKKNITNFVYQPGYFKTTKASKGKTKTRFVSPQILIDGRDQFEFSADHLTDPEVEWIANELNAWLRTNQS